MMRHYTALETELDTVYDRGTETLNSCYLNLPRHLTPLYILEDVRPSGKPRDQVEIRL
jgi:hypothetical protein